MVGLDDVVMGGRSSGAFSLNADGFGVFQGDVSLENNGGFSSVRYRFQTIGIKGCTRVVIRLKGDGKKYQFRIKSNSADYYSYNIWIRSLPREIFLSAMYQYQK